VSREWVRRQPGSRRSWNSLAAILTAEGDFSNASAALQSGPRFNDASLDQMDLWIRTGEFDKADRYWRTLLESGGRRAKADALAAGVSSMLAQGRYNEAVVLAQRMRTIPGDPSDAIQHATALFAHGQFRASGILFDSIAAVPFSTWPSRNARHRAWMLSLAAGSYAAAGDTARLRVLNDSVRIEGSRSGYRRDQLLHHYVQGLRLRSAGRTSDAIEAFRKSIYSPVEGNSRAILELARTLVDTGRAAEAIPLLRAAIAGPVGASGQYATRTELHETLARAYELSGQPDKAVQSYRYVVHAWQNADPSLQKRHAYARERLRILSD
jgi:tetratricopeptide (TPR) repeat protein